jgi:hypothetical protein
MNCQVEVYNYSRVTISLVGLANFIHSFISSLPYDRSKASPKASSPHRAI